MLTSKPHLRTRRPSPTTVEYTVSTRPSPTSVPLQLLLALTFILRLLLTTSTLLLVYSKWLIFLPDTLPAPNPNNDIPPFFSNDFIWYTLICLHTSTPGYLFECLADSIPLLLLIPLCVLFLYLSVLRIHTTESLLVLRGLGIQTSTTSGTYLASAATRFIPAEKIQDVFINEAFRGFEVRYYLIVVVEGEEEVVVVFPKLLPRLKIVEKVWRGARGCLYDGEKRKGGERDGMEG